MNLEIIEAKLNKLFEEKFSEMPKEINFIPGGASDRKIFRIKSDKRTSIGIYNKKTEENIAFIEFSNTFLKHFLKVPEIYITSKDNKYYIEEDLGDSSLFQISEDRETSRSTILTYIERALNDLIKFQLIGKDNINFNYCYETKSFDKYQITYDFNKFWKYYFLKFVNNSKGKKLKTKTLNLITDKLLFKNSNYFMYRDFQPRNVMIKNNLLYYIDYQSGRKGPLQYDVASFLYSGSINLKEEERHYFLNYYLKQLRKKISFDKNNFLNRYYYFAVIRLLQVLGSYGFLYQKKKDKNVFAKIEKAKLNIKNVILKIKEEEIKEFLKIIAEFRIKE